MKPGGLLAGLAHAGFALLCVFTLSLCVPAANLRDPIFTRWRDWLSVAMPIYAAWQALTVSAAYLYYRSRQTTADSQRSGRALPIAMGSVLLLTLVMGGLTLYSQLRFVSQQRFVAAAPLDLRRQLGQHIVAGYRNPAELRHLLELQAIGGVFVTHHNIRGMDRATIRAMIAGWQTLRSEQGLPPLWIASDQEGGSVSRLSPPLPLQPALRSLWPERFLDTADGSTTEGDPALADRFYEYGAAQASGLRELGVNVNLAPVVDLRISHSERAETGVGFSRVLDGLSRIESRALHRQPQLVSFAATHYTRGLAAHGVVAAWKHFPGLGRARADTHWFAAQIPAQIDTLRDSDWIPFFAATNRDWNARMPLPPWIMLGHAELPELDDLYGASHSPAIVRLLRDESGFNFQGVLISDDLNMRPIVNSPGGMSGAAIRALNSGVDLLLISYDGANTYPVLEALLRAEQMGDLEPGALARSRDRLSRAARCASAHAAARPDAESQAACAP